MSYLQDIKQGLAEKNALKGYCETLLTLNGEYEEIVSSLEKANDKLKKSQDPERQKALMDLAAMARSGNGIKSIESRMSNIKK